MAAARSRIWAAAVDRMAAAARPSTSAAVVEVCHMAAVAHRMAAVAVAHRMAAVAVARRMVAVAAEAVARDIVDGVSMLARDAAVARIAGNEMHRMRLLCVGHNHATKPPQSNRCRRKIMP
jgi:hypothetical protein